MHVRVNDKLDWEAVVIFDRIMAISAITSALIFVVNKSIQHDTSVIFRPVTKFTDTHQQLSYDIRS